MRRWTWLGLVLRLDHQLDPYITLTCTWVLEDRRNQGRVQETWRRLVERMLKEKGLKSISPQSLNEFITILHIKNKNVRGAHCWLPEIT